MTIEVGLLPAVLLLFIQGLLLTLFTYFSCFNYLYAIASFWVSTPKKVLHSGKKIGVVVVAYNEKNVVEQTIEACESLTYENKLVLLADDSNDSEIIESMRDLARSKGCVKVPQHEFFQSIRNADGLVSNVPIEIWESDKFVLFHRTSNDGFKGGSLRHVHDYLNSRKIEYMYLLDADWHPQSDALERTLEVLEAEDDIAFVQTKRISSPENMNLFQKYVQIVEEGCYYVDFVGRQSLGHPTLFSGCCTLFRTDAVSEVGGFTHGHLTEDLDLTNRLWINKWKGIYLDSVANVGEVPFTYDHYRRQQERWAAGTARSFKEYFWPIVKSKNLSLIDKFSAIRQNGYFMTTLLTGIAVVLGMVTVLWLVLAWDSYAVEYYLYLLGLVRLPLLILIYGCIASNFVEPLIMILFKKKTYRDLLHLPMMVWYAWSVIPTYVIGNIKGLRGLKQDWFCTPKYDRKETMVLPGTPSSVRLLNVAVCAIAFGFYFTEAWAFGWFDEFSLLILPAFFLAAIK